MASGKSKFQISRSLDERIKQLVNCDENVEATKLIGSSDSAFILGFNYSNVTNYIGLTVDYKLHNATLPVVGVLYFKSLPSEQQIKSDLQPALDYFYSTAGAIGSNAKVDKNENLFLIYYKDNETRQAIRRVYDFTAGAFLVEQPKLSTLDDSKIYAHSAVIKLSLCLKLELYESKKTLASRDKIAAVIDSAKSMLTNTTKSLKIHLNKSNFSSSNPLIDKSALESLYSHLDVPDEVQQMGDYLPQMTKEERKKQYDKWRNKVRDQRAPLEFHLEHDDLSMNADDSAPDNYYKLTIDEFMYLHVNDTISKSVKYMLLMLRQKLELTKRVFVARGDGEILESNELKWCTFKPAQVNHFVPAVYLIQAQPDATNYKQLAECRAELHHSYLIAMDQPVVRYTQRVTNVDFKTTDELKGYLCNVHTDVQDKSGIKGGSKTIISGTYTYHHYLQDRAQDSGWGCAYRSLQTIISWYKHQGYIYSPDVDPAGLGKVSDKSGLLRQKLYDEARVPTHEEIQSVLVDVGDKEASFIGSQKWIGSQEVCYVLNHLYNIDSKFISVSSGSELVYRARDLGQHFSLQSTPIMIGGGVLAHTIIGIDFNEKNGDISYLILDPHYTGSEDLSVITKKGWCGWKKNAFWDKSSFYNLCLPQRPANQY